FEVANRASPGNWDTLLGNPATPSFTTTGNNVRDAENWNSANNPTTPLGFDEGHWNAQENNFGKPTLGNDSLFGDVQAGAVTGGFPTFAGRDNANMSTRPDGQHSITNQYLWQPLPGSFYAPCVDGDFDASIPGHEFGHMIENRMIGKGNRRAGTHAGAMGEA